jgi:hypothetical protein
MTGEIMIPSEIGFHKRGYPKTMIAPYHITIHFNQAIDGKMSKCLWASYYEKNNDLFDFYSELLESTPNQNFTIGLTKLFSISSESVEKVTVDDDLDYQDQYYNHIIRTGEFKRPIDLSIIKAEYRKEKIVLFLFKILIFILSFLLIALISSLIYKIFI